MLLIWKKLRVSLARNTFSPKLHRGPITTGVGIQFWIGVGRARIWLEADAKPELFFPVSTGPDCWSFPLVSDPRHQLFPASHCTLTRASKAKPKCYSSYLNRHSHSLKINPRDKQIQRTQVPSDKNVIIDISIYLHIHVSLQRRPK